MRSRSSRSGDARRPDFRTMPKSLAGRREYGDLTNQ
jgi:hypothetical protein